MECIYNCSKYLYKYQTFCGVLREEKRVRERERQREVKTRDNNNVPIIREFKNSAFPFIKIVHTYETLFISRVKELQIRTKSVVGHTQF